MPRLNLFTSFDIILYKYKISHKYTVVRGCSLDRRCCFECSCQILHRIKNFDNLIWRNFKHKYTMTYPVNFYLLSFRWHIVWKEREMYDSQNDQEAMRNTRDDVRRNQPIRAPPLFFVSVYKSYVNKRESTHCLLVVVTKIIHEFIFMIK